MEIAERELAIEEQNRSKEVRDFVQRFDGDNGDCIKVLIIFFCRKKIPPKKTISKSFIVITGKLTVQRNFTFQVSTVA